MYYDQLGYIHKLTPENFDAGSKLLGHGNSGSIFGKVSNMCSNCLLLRTDGTFYVNINERVFSFVCLVKLVGVLLLLLFWAFHLFICLLVF